MFENIKDEINLRKALNNMRAELMDTFVKQSTEPNVNVVEMQRMLNAQLAIISNVETVCKNRGKF